MTIAARVIRILVRVLGVLQVTLGVLFWTGNQYQFIPMHMLLGLLLVALLWTMAILGAVARVDMRFVGLAAVWGVIVIALGLNQASLLPGDLHWVTQVLHLAVGVALIAQVESLGARILRSARRASPPAAVSHRQSSMT